MTLIRIHHALVFSASILVEAGCAHYPNNARMNHYDPQSGYRFRNLSNTGNSDSLQIFLAFSGGDCCDCDELLGGGVAVRLPGRRNQLELDTQYVCLRPDSKLGVDDVARSQTDLFDPGPVADATTRRHRVLQRHRSCCFGHGERIGSLHVLAPAKYPICPGRDQRQRSKCLRLKRSSPGGRRICRRRQWWNLPLPPGRTNQHHPNPTPPTEDFPCQKTPKS